MGTVRERWTSGFEDSQTSKRLRTPQDLSWLRLSRSYEHTSSNSIGQTTDAGGRSVPLLVGGRGDGLLCDPLDRGLPHIVGELYILLQRK
ncbi:hypothetical protein B296_00021792 [Ensete ventricosum]|uniref:Uncharacterized protein n=1 Tax=Ensete ventricosum TaxID=4639 RepID=A0A426ZKG1_ENSVE|nr:hypothetical protein B296_00021792 [Ensete ventricosum]